MKTTSVAVLALISASALAQPIVVLQKTNLNTRDIAPSDFADLEARKVHINWGKVGKFFKGAAKIATSILFKRNEDGDLFLVARDFIDDDGELLARDFDDDFLEARDIDDYLEARGFDDEYLEARDFDDEYLEARDFDDEYLEARDLEERSRFSELGHIAHGFRHGGPARHIHFHGLAPQQQDNGNERRDLEERSLFGTAARIGEDIFHHAHRVHKVASYIPQRQNNQNQRRDLEERSLFGTAARIGEDIFHHAHKVHKVASYIPQRQNNQNQRRSDNNNNNNNNNNNKHRYSRRDLLEADSLYNLD